MSAPEDLIGQTPEFTINCLLCHKTLIFPTSVLSLTKFRMVDSPGDRESKVIDIVMVNPLKSLTNMANLIIAAHYKLRHRGIKPNMIDERN